MELDVRTIRILARLEDERRAGSAFGHWDERRGGADICHDRPSPDGERDA